VRCIILFGSIVIIHLLNIRLDLVNSLSLGFAVNQAFYNSLFFKAANLSDAKNSMLSVYIPTIPKASFLVVINRQELYNNVVISSFFLWCL
jgi:hypothetical protein